MEATISAEWTCNWATYSDRASELKPFEDTKAGGVKGLLDTKIPRIFYSASQHETEASDHAQFSIPIIDLKASPKTMQFYALAEVIGGVVWECEGEFFHIRKLRNLIGTVYKEFVYFPHC